MCQNKTFSGLCEPFISSKLRIYNVFLYRETKYWSLWQVFSVYFHKRESALTMFPLKYIDIWYDSMYMGLKC